ncbi:MAG: GTP 3',8-cyclase MoaA [Planctomycetes bacterium]|jgi:cyclic pyranopterin phosphate synthase|nr:GTP 3',8-cyclase MoaA [Planctomycetota bacterium]
MPPVPDRFGRPLRNLRLSVTDRCNLRCQYCMPEEEYVWLPKSNVLTFEETMRLVDIFVTLGVDKVRLTGGEPLLRAELPVLVRMLAQRPALRDLAMTSNGVLLREHARALREAGLHRLTVSLDTLDAETFKMLSRRPDHHRVLDGIQAAREAGFEELKIDTVVIAGVNDGELAALLGYARSVGAELRFIEYMDVGGATHWRLDRVVSRARMLELLAASHGPITELPRTDSAPAERFRLGDGTTFGIISSVTQPFCATCDRARLTADGMWYTCLYATTGTDLRALLRGGASDAVIRQTILDVWTGRTDRGAEERAAMPLRMPMAPVSTLRQDPHLEMHTRGG